MGLYNPILGNIPQPNSNSKEVSFILPKSNYSANVVTPLVMEKAFYVLEDDNTDGTRTTTIQTNSEMILTGIYFNYFLEGAISTYFDIDIAYDIYINGEKIFSVNKMLRKALSATDRNNTYEREFLINIQNWKIPPNSTLTMIKTMSRVGSGNKCYFNISFIGYDSTKL